jgi:hypothetical protein
MLEKRTPGTPLSEAELQQRRDAARARWAEGAVGGAAGAVGAAVLTDRLNRRKAGAQVRAGQASAETVTTAAESRIKQRLAEAATTSRRAGGDRVVGTYGEFLQGRIARRAADIEAIRAGRGVPAYRVPDIESLPKDAVLDGLAARQAADSEMLARVRAIPPARRVFVEGGERRGAAAHERTVKVWTDPTKENAPPPARKRPRAGGRGGSGPDVLDDVFGPRSGSPAPQTTAPELSPEERARLAENARAGRERKLAGAEAWQAKAEARLQRLREAGEDKAAAKLERDLFASRRRTERKRQRTLEAANPIERATKVSRLAAEILAENRGMPVGMAEDLAREELGLHRRKVKTTVGVSEGRPTTVPDRTMLVRPRWPGEELREEWRREIRGGTAADAEFFQARTRTAAEAAARRARAGGIGAARATLARFPKMTRGRLAALGAAGALVGALGAGLAKRAPATSAELDKICAAARPPRSYAEAEAGTYPKAHLNLHGMRITIETPRGSERIGWKREGGVKWRCTMPGHYGYVRGSKGADGDHIDVTLGPKALDPACPVWVVDQHRADGSFDEHKCFLGWPTREAAIGAYDASFSDGRGSERRRGVTRMELRTFREWATGNATAEPLAKAAHRVFARWARGTKWNAEALSAMHPRGARVVTSPRVMRPDGPIAGFYVPRQRAASDLYMNPSTVKRGGGAGSLQTRTHELTHVADTQSRFPLVRHRGMNRALQAIGDLTHRAYPRHLRGVELTATLGEMLSSRHHGSRRALNNFTQNLGPRLAARGAPGASAVARAIGREFRVRGLLRKSVGDPDAPDALAKAAPSFEGIASRAEAALAGALGRVFRRWGDDPRAVGNEDEVSEALDPVREVFLSSAELAADQAVPPPPPPGSGTDGPGTPGGPDRRITVDLDARRPDVERHLREYSLKRIREISDASRQTIRDVLVRASISGASTQQQAREIRDSIGLTSAQAGWVRTFRFQLDALDPRVMGRALRDRRFDPTVQKALDGGPPLTEEQVDKMVAAYHRRTLAYRATMIARTEAIRAANVGGVAGMRAQLEETPDFTVVKTWQATTTDDRTRDSHVELHGKEVEGLDTPFIIQHPVTGATITIRWPHDTEASAEETVQCRCTLKFRLVPKPGANPIRRLTAEAV